jgi:hypothetical protein
MYQEARDSYSHKFDSPFTAWLWDVSMTGCDAETGDTDTFGWYGLMGRNILCQQSTGYVYRARYASVAEARVEMAILEDRYCEECGDEE